MKLIAALSILFTVSFTHANECPVAFETDYLEKVATLATNAESCWEAKTIVESCALGASGDVYTVSAAILRCEKDMPQMSKKNQETKSYLHERCNDKYAEMQGTMYRSANIFCHLSVTELFLNILSREE